MEYIGDIVSLGYYETQDTMMLMDKLMNEFDVRQFILWGRSMGAVTALMISTKYKVNIGSILLK